MLIKIISAAILSGLVVMQKCLEKKGKTIILRHTAFCIGLFQQADFSLHVTCMMHLIRKPIILLVFTKRLFYCNFGKVAFSKKLPQIL